MGLSLTRINADQTTLYLGLPRQETASGIAGYSDPPAAQWRAHYQTVPDQFESDKQREVLFGTPALCVLSDEQDLSSFLTVPLARVTGITQRHYQLMTTFVPACCHIRTSDHLVSLIEHWQQALQQVHTILTTLDERTMGLNNILYATTQTLFQLQQFRQNPAWHPWQLYQTMGQWLVATAVLNQASASLPVFTQETLTTVFAELDEWVQQRLANFHNTQQTSWVLKQQQPGWWNSGPMESALLQCEQCWLLVKGLDHSPQAMKQFVELTKVAATDTIGQLLAAAMPGIPLQCHGNRVNSIGSDSATVWFALDVMHLMWQSVVKQRQLTVYTPQTDSVLELKLLFK
ncbi:MAG: hypothetical protein GKR77_06610 [Legionellales bacterium]|nr:hypothetical protein [Legionellales bacterium]